MQVGNVSSGITSFVKNFRLIFYKCYYCTTKRKLFKMYATFSVFQRKPASFHLFKSAETSTTKQDKDTVPDYNSTTKLRQ